jgi:outer membrane protein assembly factor BamD (BamD/ComL family)
MIKNCILRILFALMAAFLFSACVTTVNIGHDLSPAELIQRAQEASDRNRYNIALQYYEALLDRNRDNIDLVITAEYEIAFINYKQKNFQQARLELNAVLEYYNTPDEELLPQHFKRLAQIVLDRIDEVENQRRSFSRR